MRAMQKRLVLFGQSLWQNREDALLALIAFFAPAHFFLKADASWAIVGGLPVDYLYPKVFAVDVVIAALLLCARLPQPDKDEKKALYVWLAFCVLHLFIHAGSPFLFSSAWFLAELTLGLGLLRFFLHRAKWWRGRLLRWGVLVGLIWQTGLGLSQLTLNREVAGYVLLGEPTLSVSRADVAVSDIPSLGEQILPYGTTAHPHLLALYLTTGLFLVWILHRPQNSVLQIFILSAIFSASVLYVIARTESLTITLAAGAFAVLFFGWKKFMLPIRRFAPALLVLALLIAIGIPALLATVKNLEPSWSRRSALQALAIRAFVEHPISGVGLNQLAAESESYGFAPATYRFRQPPHHAGLLLLAETGIIGMFFFVTISLVVHRMYTVKKDVFALAVIPFALLFSLDHLLLSNRFGQLLCIVLIALVLEKRTQRMDSKRLYSPNKNRKKKS